MRRLMMLALALTLAHAASAEESYLLWMVDGTKTGDIQYDAVAVSAFTGDDVASGRLLTLYSGNGNPVGGTLVDGDSATSELPLYASLAGVASSSYSYVVELFYGDALVGQSEKLLFSDAAAAGQIATTTSAGSLPGLAAWTPANFRPVPEPSSALLALLGLGALALRRGRGRA